MTGNANRALNPIESLFWLYNQVTPFHFVIAADYAGAVDRAAWPAALDAVRQASPLLSSRIEAEAGGPRFAADDRPLPVTFAGGDWRSVFAEEVHTPFGPSGPLWRASVVNSERGATLVLAFHRAIADGISAVHLQ